MKPVKTVGDIIDLLGRKRLSIVLSVGDTAVSNSKKRGQFPAAWYAVVKTELEMRGHACPVECFSFRSGGKAA